MVNSASTSSSRFMELEGLRGLAAIVVVLFHALLMFYPGLFYGPEAYAGAWVQNMRLEDNLYGSPIMGLFTGSFSVAIFFVLSGFVLSIGFFNKKDVRAVQRLAVKRYIRLMIPAAVSILLAYLAIKFGFGYARSQVVDITHSVWLSGLWLQVPQLEDAIRQSIYQIFTIGSSSYNPVLWTMQYEFIGSFIVFAFLLLFAESKYRWVIYAALTAVFLSSWYWGFIIGMALADLYMNRRSLLEKIPQAVWFIGGLLGIGLGAFPPTNLEGTIYKALLVPGWSQYQSFSFYLTIGAMLMIMAVLFLPVLRSFFAARLMSYLGKYSFSVYLLHMPILFTFGSLVFISTNETIGFHSAAIVTILSSFALLAPLVYLFEKYVDAPAIKLASHVGDVYEGRRGFNLTSSRLMERVSYSIVGLRKTQIFNKSPTQLESDE